MSGLREPVAHRKAIRAGSLPWNQRLEQRAAAFDKQARSPCRLLEQPTEAAHRFQPVRLFEASRSTIGARCSGIAPRLPARRSRPVQSRSIK